MEDQEPEVPEPEGGKKVNRKAASERQCVTVLEREERGGQDFQQECQNQ